MKKKYFAFFVLATVTCFFIWKGMKVSFKKDCSSLYKKYSKNLSKDPFHLSSKQEKILLEHLDSCTEEKEIWLLFEMLSKNYSRQGLILKLKRLEKKAIELAYYKWNNYEKAIKYYSRLLNKPLDPGEQFLFQYQKAKSFLMLKKVSQALIEIEKCFFKGISQEERRKAFLLKLQILIFQKNFSVAIALIENMIKDLPKDQDFLRESLAVVYESQNKLSLAVEELKQIKKRTSFIEIKIKRLEERIKNQP